MRRLHVSSMSGIGIWPWFVPLGFRPACFYSAANLALSSEIKANSGPKDVENPQTTDKCSRKWTS
jgi:hypothetical protein